MACGALLFAPARASALATLAALALGGQVAGHGGFHCVQLDGVSRVAQ